MNQQVRPNDHIVRYVLSCAGHHSHVPPWAIAETNVKTVREPGGDPVILATRQYFNVGYGLKAKMLDYCFLYVSILRPGIDQCLVGPWPWLRHPRSCSPPLVSLGGREPHGNFHERFVNAPPRGQVVRDNVAFVLVQSSSYQALISAMFPSRLLKSLDTLSWPFLPHHSRTPTGLAW